MDEKAAARIAAKSLRARLSEKYIAEADETIYRGLIMNERYITAKRVFAYLSCAREVSTDKIIRHAIECGREVYLPITYPDGAMEFGRYMTADDLVPGRYGIPEPKNGCEKAIPQAGDVIIVPALCYDREYYRLGRGGGYYDRLLAGTKACSIGLCRAEEMCERVPRKWNDIPVCCVISDK